MEKENWKEMKGLDKVLYAGICLCFILMIVAVALQMTGVWAEGFMGVRVLLSVALVFEGIRSIKKKTSTAVFCFAVAVFILVLSYMF